MSKRWITAATTLGAATMVFAAAMFAQTPVFGGVLYQATATTAATSTASPAVTITGTAATATASPAATGTVVTGTVSPVATGTVVTGTGTAVTTPVASPPVVPTIAVPTTVYVPGGTGNFRFAHAEFQRVWERTDRLLNEGRVKRSYFWGPGPNTPGLLEAYAEAPGGTGQRLVQYFDKSRMEINNPQANPRDPFFVTNGLLTVEMIAGRIQVGNNTFVNFHPACIPMSGDFGDMLAPTYAGFAKVSSVESGNNPATNRVGQTVVQTIDRDGNVMTDTAKGADPKVQITAFFTETNHNVPRVFMDFLNQRGPVYQNGLVTDARLIDPLVFVTGYPISEPYWARATIRGQVRDVLIQAFQRRALTYVPTNEPAFQVEMANIGQHYFDWRYRNFGFCPGQTPGTPTAPVPAPTSPTTPVTGTRTVAAGTATATTVPGTVVRGTTTPGATGTAATATATTEPGITTTPRPTFTVPAGVTTTPNPTFTLPAGTATTVTTGKTPDPPPPVTVTAVGTPVPGGTPQPIPVTPTRVP